MKYVKTLGLAALAAMAVMAFVGASVASATIIESGSTKLGAGTVIDASLSGTASLTTTEGTVLVTCSGGTVKGETTNAGSSTETVKGFINSLTWGPCTEPTSTIATGGLEIHWTSGKNGTLTSTGGTEVTVNTTIFGSCVFTVVSGNTIGTVTGVSSGNATLDVNAVVQRLSGLCPNTEKWVGTYTITSPAAFAVTTS